MNYADPSLTAPRRRWPFRLAVAAVALLLLLGGLSFVPVRRVVNDIDAVAGSTREQTSWLGVRGVAIVSTSPLETRLKSAKIDYRPDWHTLSDYEYSVLGFRNSRGHGTAPPVHAIYRWLDRWVATATEDELRNYVRIMQTGTETEQRAVVQAMIDRIFDE
jgi:hypothetical protein